MNQKMSFFTFLASLVRLLKGKPNIPPALAENALLRTILNRRSVRSFTGQEIPDDIFATILEAGRLAPSTVNLQTWSFAVFDADLWQQTFDRAIPFHGRRALIVIADTCRDRQVLDIFPYSPLVEHTVAVMNASLAAMNMNIAAEALGVATVMLSETGRSGLLDIKYLQEKLCLPSGAIPLMTIVFGYPLGPHPPMPPKLPSEQIFFHGHYPPPNRQTMADWLSQMAAGYMASHPGSSFQKQLNVYQKKIGQAERELEEAIYQRNGKQPATADDPQK
jgi:nitroreductase